MADVYLNINILVLEGTHIILVVTCREVEVTGTLGYILGELLILGEVVPVRVHQEDHLLDLAGAYDTHQILRKRAVISKVLDAADGNARQAVLAGLLGLLLALLDEETVYMLLLRIEVTDALRDVDRSAGTVR